MYVHPFDTLENTGPGVFFHIPPRPPLSTAHLKWMAVEKRCRLPDAAAPLP